MNLKLLNAQLKQLNIGVTVRQKGSRLNLRATLPPKPRSSRNHPHQQEISLGIYANTEGMAYAKSEAMKLGAALATKSFSWDGYLKSPIPEKISAREWIEKYEKDYFNRRQRTPQSETTWDKDYRLTFAKLPQDEPLSIENCLKLIGQTSPNSRARQRYVMALKSLCKFAGLEADFKGLGKYSSPQLTPRNLPSDDLIVESRNLIVDPAWQWVYGMLVVYGLRPHEVFLVDCDRLGSKDCCLYVTGGKTGSRIVFPFFEKWWEEWELWECLIPTVKAKRNSEYGDKILRKFKQYKIPFNPYDLRHAWAVRTLALGLDRTLAAQQMGHSREVHDKTYHKWISEQKHREIFNNLKQG